MEPQHRPVSDAGKLSLHFCSGPRKTRGVRGVKSLESGPPFGTLESAFHPPARFWFLLACTKRNPAHGRKRVSSSGRNLAGSKGLCPFYFFSPRSWMI